MHDAEIDWYSSGGLSRFKFWRLKNVFTFVFLREKFEILVLVFINTIQYTNGNYIKHSIFRQHSRSIFGG